MHDQRESTKIKLRGFASLDPERRREIASKGGKTGGHRWTAEEASMAGKKGGRISRRRPSNVVLLKG